MIVPFYLRRLTATLERGNGTYSRISRVNDGIMPPFDHRYDTWAIIGNALATLRSQTVWRRWRGVIARLGRRFHLRRCAEISCLQLKSRVRLALQSERLLAIVATADCGMMGLIT